MNGSGTNGGFASGNTAASSYGGVAISNGRSVANGWGARSHANTRAKFLRRIRTQRQHGDRQRELCPSRGQLPRQRVSQLQPVQLPRRRQPKLRPSVPDVGHVEPQLIGESRFIGNRVHELRPPSASAASRR